VGDFFASNLAALVLVLAGLILVVMLVLQALQISRLRVRIDALTGGEEGDLEAVLTEHIELVHEVARDLDELAARTAVTEAAARHHFSKQGLVRFSPFQDTGGDQSFALALLDESDDGIVVSSLHSRTGTRIYAKSIVGGKAPMTLSTEETQALDEARASHHGPAVTARAAANRTKADAAAAAAAAARAARAVVAEPADERVPARTAPAAKPAPARGSSAAPATAAKASPAPVAKAAPDEPDSETVQRPSAHHSKGQEKAAVALDAPTAGDSERTGRKPGRSGTA